MSLVRTTQTMFGPFAASMFPPIPTREAEELLKHGVGVSGDVTAWFNASGLSVGIRWTMSESLDPDGLSETSLVLDREQFRGLLAALQRVAEQLDG